MGFNLQENTYFLTTKIAVSSGLQREFMLCPKALACGGIEPVVGIPQEAGNV